MAEMRSILFFITLTTSLMHGCSTAQQPVAAATATEDGEIVCPAESTASASFLVTDTDGRPIPQAAITLRHPDGEISVHFLSNDIGRATTKCLTPARGYEIEVTKEGFVAQRMPANFFANIRTPVTVRMKHVK